MKNTLTVYHNPRCRKSREAINYLNQLNIDYNIVLYLTNHLTKISLKNLLSKLKIKAINLVRKKELLWKSEFSKKKLNEDEIILIMISNPKLIERPIIEYQDQAIIGKPIDKLYDFLEMIKL